jgi:hypothetical protein
MDGARTLAYFYLKTDWKAFRGTKARAGSPNILSMGQQDLASDLQQ